MDDLIVLRPQGLYCPRGDFYIDPWRPVSKAVITHAMPTMRVEVMTITWPIGTAQVCSKPGWVM